MSSFFNFSFLAIQLWHSPWINNNSISKKNNLKSSAAKIPKHVPCPPLVLAPHGALARPPSDWSAWAHHDQQPSCRRWRGQGACHLKERWGFIRRTPRRYPTPPPFRTPPRFKVFFGPWKKLPKMIPKFYPRIVGFGSLTGFFNWGVWTWGGVFGEGHWYLIQDRNKKRETGWKVPLFGIFNRSCWRVQWRAEI